MLSQLYSEQHMLSSSSCYHIVAESAMLIGHGSTPPSQMLLSICTGLLPGIFSPVESPVVSPMPVVYCCLVQVVGLRLWLYGLLSWLWLCIVVPEI
jgi:hypothetical protein